MEQAPKIVRERLRTVQQPEVHPDADLLTAFAEKSLTQREQAQVLEHLAGCATCREVMAFAQPQNSMAYVAAAATAPSAQPVRSWWTQGALLRWAALTACVVVVAGVVISRSHFASRSNEVALDQKKDEVAVTAKVEPPVPAATVTIETKNEKDQRREFDKLSSAKTTRKDNAISAEAKPQAAAPAAEGSRDLKVNELPSSGRNAVALQKLSPGASPAAVPPPSPSLADSEAAKKQLDAAQLPQVRSQSETVTVEANAVVVQTEPTQAPVSANQQQRAQAADSLAFKSKDDAGYIGGVSGGAMAGRVRFPIPRFQLSQEGKLIRSKDAGDNWQTLPVGDAKTAFRALCVTGKEVWVGGAQGNLFYSADAGDHWEQVKPAIKGQALTADITAIEFKDPQHGSITTSDHQTWTTSDNGHSWQVQSR